MKIAILVLLASVAGSAHADFKWCIERLAGDPEYAPLAAHMATGPTANQTFGMSADTAFATDAERPLIAEWAKERDACYVSNAEQISQLPLVMQNLTAKVRLQGQAANIDLYNRKITYGEFAQRRSAINGEYEAALNVARAEWQREVQTNNQANAQAEANRRQQLIMQLQANQRSFTPYQLPMPQMPTTTQTNCLSSGNMINCTSR